MSRRQRSLGTKRVEGNPIRLGIINENEQELRSRTRASNIGSRSSIDNLAKYVTPVNTRIVTMAKSTNPHDPQIPSFSGAGIRFGIDRTSYSARKNTPLGRSSAIGAKKDLDDKTNQQLAEREIVEFCRSNGYDRVDNLQVDGPKTSFPLNATEFRFLFTFIMKIYEPTFEGLEQKTMAEKIPVLLKTLGYAGHVSKTMFQTLGTKHSWTSVLAILRYLVHRAEQLINIGNNWKAIGFSSPDEDGFVDCGVESEELIRFEFFAKSYRAWDSNGTDNFNEYLDELESRFYRREGLDRRELDKVSREAKESRNQLQDVKSKKHQEDEEIKKLKDSLQSKRKDAEIMKDYAEKAKKHHTFLLKELDMIKVTSNALYETKISLEKAILDLMADCKERGETNMDPFSTQHTVAMLEKSENDEKELIKNLDNQMWEKERELAKIVKDINDTCQCFNEKLINLGLYRTNISDDHDTSKAFKLEIFTDLNDVIEWLNVVECSWKTDKKLKDEELSNMNKEMHLLESDHKIKTNNLEQIRNSKVKINKDIRSKETNIKMEETLLKEKLTNLKDEIHVEKAKDRKNLEESNRELNLLKDEKEELIMKKNRKEEQGKDLITQASDKFLTDRRKALEIFNEFKKSYEKAAKDKLDRINAENRAIVAYVADLRENLEVTKARKERQNDDNRLAEEGARLAEEGARLAEENARLAEEGASARASNESQNDGDRLVEGAGDAYERTDVDSKSPSSK